MERVNLPIGDSVDSRLRGNDGRFYARFGQSGALIGKTRLPCGMGTIGGAAPGSMHAKTKPAKGHDIHGQSPNVTADSRGTVVEALCERYKLPVVVGFPGS